MSTANTFQEPSQGFHLLGVLAQHEATQADEFIPVDLLDGAAPALRAESQNVIEIGMPHQGILEAHGFARWAEIK